MPIKIAMIGAGSIGFTRLLMRDILVAPGLEDTRFAFMDISKRNLDMVTQLARRDIMYAQRSIPALLELCRDIRELASDDALFLNYSNPMAINSCPVANTNRPWGYRMSTDITTDAGLNFLLARHPDIQQSVIPVYSSPNIHPPRIRQSP